MLTLVIGNKAYSSWSLRPWLFLAHHDIAFREVRVPLYTDGHRAKLLVWSPAGKVPLLADGDLRVWESLAILEYLAERFPGKQGWPADPAARAHARAIASEMHAGFAALRAHCTMNVRRAYAPRTWPAEVEADIARIESMWNDCRARAGEAGPFLFGAFGIADCMYAPVVWRFHTYSLPLAGAARAYRDTMLALPAMRAWVADAARETEVLAQFEHDDWAPAERDPPR